MKSTSEPRVPHAAFQGNVWPAVPDEKGQMLLAILYQLEQTQWWSADDLRLHQHRQLAALLNHTWETVPFYRDRLEAAVLTPPFADLGDAWLRLPPLSRADIQAAGNDIHTLKLPADHGSISDIHTSGSTGKPVRALRSQLTLRFWSAFTLREHLWHRRDLRGKLAVIRNSTAGQDMYPDGSRYQY